jgi:hypothetical protein
MPPVLPDSWFYPVLVVYAVGVVTFIGAIAVQAFRCFRKQRQQAASTQE